MKKAIYYIAITGIAIVLFSACNKSKKENQDSTATTVNSNELQTGKRTKYPFIITSYNTDALPIDQTFKEKPKRIIANNLSSVETLLELGLGDEIVGITKPDNEVNGKWKDTIEKLNILGDKITISKEIILGQKPDIIVGSARGLTDQYQGSIQTYNEHGVNVFTQSASILKHNPKLSVIIDDVRMLGQIFDVKDRAEVYAKQLEEKYTKIKNLVSQKDNAEKKLTLLTMLTLDSSKGTYSSFDISIGLPLDALDVLNLETAIKGHAHNNSYENLISINPDIILYIKVDAARHLDADAVETIKKEPLLKNVSAIKSNRVFTANYDDFMDYGPRNFDALTTLYHNIYNKE